jgi:hypothetical protein
VKLVSRAWLELGHSVEVKCTRLSGLGMNEEAPAADVVGKLDEAGEDVLQKGCSESFALVADVYAETCEQSNGLRVATSALSHPGGRRRAVDLSHAPGVVSHDEIATVLSDHEDPCAPGCR